MKDFIGYEEDDTVYYFTLMREYIKSFSGRNTSLLVDNDSILNNYNEIWSQIKSILNIKFHSKPVHDEKYIKAKVKRFNDVVNTNFLGGEKPKECMHYAYIACISIESVIKIEKNNYPEVYLEECKYKMKKKRCLYL